jgi:hypothetical protein
MKSNLLVWKLLIPLVFGILVFLISVDPATLENLRRSRMFVSQLNDVRFNEADSGVLIIGNSLLQHALPPDKVITARFRLEIAKQKSRQTPIKAFKIAVPGLPTIELKKNANKIFSLHPKLIVIQSELIFPNYPIKDPPANLAAYYQARIDRLQQWARLMKVCLAPSLQRIRISARTEKLLGSGKTNMIDSQKREKPPEDDFQAQRLQWIWHKRDIRRNSFDSMVCKEFIDAAHSAGIQVAVLDMPVSLRTMTVVPVHYLEDRSAAIRGLLGPSDFYFHYPGALGDDLFSDYSHLTVRGRALFFRWLTQEFGHQWNQVGR